VIGGRIFAKYFLTGAVLCAAPVFALEAAKPAIVWIAERGASAVEVTGLPPPVLAALGNLPRSPEEWAALFSVEVASRDGANAPAPIVGEWEVREGRLRFVPRYPWFEGVKYRADFRLQNGPAVTSFFEHKPTGASTPTRVAAVYPSASELPENQLKFYVQFSGPMRRGDVYQHIRLRNARGEPI
jgi:hypothetical protein